jgi:DNA-directed RNA polymerase specialized sigma24 family protein
LISSSGEELGAMIYLIPSDHGILEQISGDLGTEEEKQDILKQLTDGFSLYATEEMMEKFTSRSEFFHHFAHRLIENLVYAGKSSVDVFTSPDGRRYLCSLIRSMGVPASDVEDLAQDITRKFWRGSYAERYNPLISSWSYFVSYPVSNLVKTYYQRRKKKVTTFAVSLDQADTSHYDQPSLSRKIYSQDPTVESEKVMLVCELLTAWEDFLAVQESLKSVVYRGFRRMATLLPPGIPEIRIEKETEVGFLGGGRVHSRITTELLQEEGKNLSVHNSLLVDYISLDPLTQDPLIDPVTGQPLCQKFYFNPDYVERKHSFLFKKLCTLLAPGTPEYPVSEETTLFYFSKRQYYSRVSPPDWYREGRFLLVPNSLLVDYFAIDEVNRDVLKDRNGAPLIHKHYINPEYLEQHSGYRIEHRFLDIYHYLRDGYQIDEIARVFRVSDAVVPLWVARLKSLFRDFWLISDQIPTQLKKLAVETYQCPQCHRLSQTYAEYCISCQSDMANTSPEIRFNTYPWPRVYRTRQTMERIEEHRKVFLPLQECSV